MNTKWEMQDEAIAVARQKAESTRLINLSEDDRRKEFPYASDWLKAIRHAMEIETLGMPLVQHKRLFS